MYVFIHREGKLANIGHDQLKRELLKNPDPMLILCMDPTTKNYFFAFFSVAGDEEAASFLYYQECYSIKGRCLASKKAVTVHADFSTNQEDVDAFPLLMVDKINCSLFTLPFIIEQIYDALNGDTLDGVDVHHFTFRPFDEATKTSAALSQLEQENKIARV